MWQHASSGAWLQGRNCGLELDLPTAQQTAATGKQADVEGIGQPAKASTRAAEATGNRAPRPHASGKKTLLRDAATTTRRDQHA